MIEVEGLTVRFGGVTPLDDMTVSSRQGTCGLIGPERRRQDDVLQRPQRLRQAGHRVGRARSARTCSGMADYRRARWGLRRTFQTEQAIEQPVGLRQRRDDPRALGGQALRPPAPTYSTRSSSWASRRRRETKVGGSTRGSRRLVEVARAVVGQPRVVLLDEPAAGLPDEETEHLGQVIQAIPEHFGALVILVDHDMSLVSACCETTAVLDFGEADRLRPDGRRPAGRARDAGLPRHRGGAVSADRPTLRIEELSVSRGGHPVVHEVSLAIPPGR